MNWNAEQYVRALESGAYNQTTRRLRYKDSFCVWGVAVDMYIRQHDDICWIQSPNGYGVDGTYALGHSHNHQQVAEAAVIDKVMDWLGLSRTPVVKLMELNDYHRWKFRKIAQYIREHEKELFSEQTVPD